jgi:hypothetical protein
MVIQNPMGIDIKNNYKFPEIQKEPDLGLIIIQ